MREAITDWLVKYLSGLLLTVSSIAFAQAATAIGAPNIGLTVQIAP